MVGATASFLWRLRVGELLALLSINVVTDPDVRCACEASEPAATFFNIDAVECTIDDRLENC
jgi:hypothetical protein